MPSIYRNGIQYSSNCILESAAITAGIIAPYAGSSAPVGWLMCDGSAVSRTTYSELFNAIGTTYGAGDGSTTFNLPDLKGRVPVGAGTGTAHGTTFTIGTKDGVEYVALNINQIPSHEGHAPANNYVSGIGSGESTYYLPTHGTPQYSSDRPYVVRNGNELAMRSVSRGGGQSHTNMQPYTVLNYIISIGAQNGGFTHIKYDSVEDEYNGGIEDEYLLTDDTITALEAWLNN